MLNLYLWTQEVDTLKRYHWDDGYSFTGFSSDTQDMFYNKTDSCKSTSLLGILRDFGIKGKGLAVSADDCRVFVKTLQEGLFKSESKLKAELMRAAKDDTRSPEKLE